MPTGYTGRTTAPTSALPMPTKAEPKALYDWALRFITIFRQRERRFASGIVDLSVTLGSTAVSDSGVLAGDIVMLSPMNSAAVTAAAFVLEANVDNGAFGISHTVSATPRRMAYLVTRSR